jgi:hypothetical protein
MTTINAERAEFAEQSSRKALCGLCGLCVVRRVGGLLALLAIVVGGVVIRAAEIIDRVVAVVTGDVIMLSDVRAANDFGLIEADAAADSERAILSRLIERSLILDEVDRYTPAEPAAAAVDEQLRAVLA